jgi:hypothetical protein
MAEIQQGEILIRGALLPPNMGDWIEAATFG